MTKKRKKKFQHNTRKIKPDQMLKQLYNEHEVLHKIVTDIKLGECENLASSIFPKLRSLVCYGTWTMKPLLPRVMEEYNIQLQFFASKPISGNDTLGKLIGAKLWSSVESDSLKLKVNLEQYLAQELLYNPIEQRYVSRNELIRIIADSEGAHYDTEINKFSDWLSNSSASFNGIQVSQKELFMWDIYMLVDWHINRIKIELKYRNRNSGTFNYKLANEKYNEILKTGQHYDSQLRSAILEFSFIGNRLCNNCKSPKLNKPDEFTLKCEDCGNIINL